MLPGGDYLYLLYKYRRGHFDRMLRKYLSDWKLEQLTVPVQSVTVDLISGKPILRDREDAVNSILESINLPVFSKPICREGQALVDGGLVDNIPADVLVRSGCNFVIAVSVTAKMEAAFARNRQDTPTSKMAVPSVLQTMMRSYLVQNVNMNSVNIRPADIVIEPEVADVDLSEFSRTSELAVLGEEATLRVIPNIKSLLAQLDKQLFACDS
jgi:NTE family protein